MFAHYAIRSHDFVRGLGCHIIASQIRHALSSFGAQPQGVGAFALPNTDA